MKRQFSAACHCFYLGWREAWAQKAALASTFGFYIILIIIWSSIWRMVPAAAMARTGLTHEQMIWYFTLTELVMFTLSHMYRDVQEDIHGGMMTMFFLRPVGYITLKTAEWMGHGSLKLLLFGTVISAFTFILTGIFPFGAVGLCLLIVMLFLATFLWLLLQTMLGLCAAWLPSVRPVFMVVQKFVFVLGGMIVPVALFPRILRAIAFATPFPAILYAPASLVEHASITHVLYMLGMQLAWIVLALLALFGMKLAFEKRLLAKGEL